MQMLGCAVLVSLCAGLVSANVRCPDGHQCLDKNTCCLTKKGYGCCGYPKAVCCSDLLHCCPAGYHCSHASQACVRDAVPWYRLPWLKTTPDEEPETTSLELSLPKFDSNAIQERPSNVAVVHCDNRYYCPDGATCCRNLFGRWSCCRYTLGQCCRDGIHCCPYGYHCLTSLTCARGGLRIPATSQLPALTSDDYQDPCCLSEAGCCQEGFHCDREQMACVRVFAPPVPWASLVQAPEDDSVALASVIHCEGRFYCPDGSSCCQAPSGEWGCCPYQLGNCCMDGRHCCEYKWTCDPTSMHCVKEDTYIPSATMREIQQL